VQSLKSDVEALLSLFEINDFPAKFEHGMFMVRRDVWDDQMELVTMPNAHEQWTATTDQDKLMECYGTWIERGKPIRKPLYES
jgi:hypothetical protein